MSDSPLTIWADLEGRLWFDADADDEHIRYVRADLVADLEAEVERLKAALAEWKPCPYCGEYTYRKLPEKQL